MTTGQQLTTFITSLNAEATVDATLLEGLVETAKAIIEGERPWMVLRKTTTSKTASPANTWQTAISLSDITDFSRFYSDVPIRLFDGNNRIEYYSLKPFDRRLEYKDVSNTAVFDHNTKTLYLNGVVPFSGTLYINYVSTTATIDLTSSSAIWTVFPSRFIPVLGFYAIGIYKGAVDYDSINRMMLPENRATLQALRQAMESWDNELQLADLETNDPTDLYAYPRSGAIDRYHNN